MIGPTRPLGSPHLDMQLDLPWEVTRIAGFLREELARSPRHGGFVVGMSGGIDSALVGALAVEAVGRASTYAVLLPERESSREGVRVARCVVQHLGIKSTERDITPVLDTLGIYEDREVWLRTRVPDFGTGWTYRLKLPGDLRHHGEMNVYRLEVIDPRGQSQLLRLRPAELRALQAATNVKQRVRMIELYREAEKRGWLVGGTTNLVELETGFFVRHGDGGVDVEPLAHLYKSQVYQLARYLGLPDAVLQRSPSPDTWSAEVSDEEFYLRLPYEIVDRLLLAEKQGVGFGQLARFCGLPEATARRALEELHRRRHATQRNRELPPCLLKVSTSTVRKDDRS